MNLDAVLAACERLPELGITNRRTADLHRRLDPRDRAAGRQEPMPMRLALSLHAADDALRSELMPVNDRYPLADVLAACRAYYERKRRQVFVEYVMLAGVNDAYAQARQLAEVLDPRSVQGQSDPLQPDRLAATQGSCPRGDRGLPGGARAPRVRRHRAADPRARHRRGLRAAGGAGLNGGAGRPTRPPVPAHAAGLWPRPAAPGAKNGGPRRKDRGFRGLQRAPGPSIFRKTW